MTVADIPMEGRLVNTKDFEKRLARLTGWTESEMDQRVRPLRDGGLFERGAGRHTPNLTALQASLILLQLVARRSTEASEVGRRTWDLKAVVPPGAPEWVRLLLEADKLPQIMSLAFELPESATIESLRLPSDGSYAWLTLRRGSLTCPVWFTADEEKTQWVSDHPDAYENQGATFVGQCFYMGAGTFAEIALGLKTEKQSGWVGDEAKA